MARTLVGDFLDPEVLAPIAMSKFTDKVFFLQNGLRGEAGSPITIIPPGQLIDRGSRLSIPLFTRISDLISQRDLTSSSAPTDQRITGDQRDIPKIRRKAGPVTWTADMFRQSPLSEAELIQEISDQIAQEMLKDMQGAIFEMVNAILGLTFGTPAISHLKDNYEPFASVASDDTAGTIGNTLSLGMINQLKSLLGDTSGDLNTIFMHTSAREDLINQNIQVGHKPLDDAAGLGVPKTLAMGEQIMDLAEFQSANPSGSRTGSGSGTGTASNALFRTYAMTPGAIQLTMPLELEIDMERRLDGEAKYWRMLGNYDFGCMASGVGWKAGSIANPDDSDLRTTSNYEDVTTGGHREVGIVAVEHNLVSQP